MERRLQLRVQRYGWDAATEFYNDAWAEHLAPAHDALFQVADLRPGQTVIETACGTGLVSFPAAKIVGQDGRVIASDLSGEMVQDLNRRAIELGIHNVKAARMDAEQLDIEDNAADRAICALGLMYVPDPDAAVLEMARVVRSGGRVSATVWGERRNCGWADVFPIVDARVASEVCPMFFATGPKGILARSFQLAGLQNIEEARISTVLNYENDDAVLTSVLLGGPVALAVKRFTPDVWAEVSQEYLASVSDFKDPSGRYAIPGEFVTVTGTKA